MLVAPSVILEVTEYSVLSAVINTVESSGSCKLTLLILGSASSITLSKDSYGISSPKSNCLMLKFSKSFV